MTLLRLYGPKLGGRVSRWGKETLLRLRRARAEQRVVAQRGVDGDAEDRLALRDVARREETAAARAVADAERGDVAAASGDPSAERVVRRSVRSRVRPSRERARETTTAAARERSRTNRRRRRRRRRRSGGREGTHRLRRRDAPNYDVSENVIRLFAMCRLSPP